jgi:hypothetical protein
LLKVTFKIRAPPLSKYGIKAIREYLEMKPISTEIKNERVRRDIILFCKS